MIKTYGGVWPDLEDSEPVESFWRIYSIADQIGLKGVNALVRRSLDDWEDDCEHLTAMVIVLDRKLWQWSGRAEMDQGVQTFADLYMSLYEQAKNYALTHLHGEELSYFLKVTE